MTEERLRKRIERTKTKVDLLKEKHGIKPSLTYTYHAGWDLGYWEGKLAVLEELLDEMEQVKEI